MKLSKFNLSSDGNPSKLPKLTEKSFFSLFAHIFCHTCNPYNHVFQQEISRFYVRKIYSLSFKKISIFVIDPLKLTEKSAYLHLDQYSFPHHHLCKELRFEIATEALALS